MILTKKFKRTKSECRPEQTLTQPRKTSHSTYMKLRPFSQQCTMTEIEEQLHSFRNTMTNSKTKLHSNFGGMPLFARLKKIIQSRPRKRKGKFSNYTQMDIRSTQNSQYSAEIDDRLKRIRTRADSVSKFRFVTQQEKQQQSENFLSQKKQAQPVSNVRHNLSQQAIDEDNAFYDTLHKPKSSTLLLNFNKNNCFLFSRSKQKVLAVQLQKIRQPIETIYKDSKFQSFGKYFYGSYMKKYVQRKKLLGKKSSLLKRVAQ